MVDIVKDYLDITDDGDFEHLSNKDKADYIVGCCETWGMIPPSTKLFKLFGNDNCWEEE